MKKTVIISSLILISFLFVSQGLFAQRYLIGKPGIEGDYCELNLTQEQIEKIDKLVLELEKELSPLFSNLQSNYLELEELEAQRSPDLTKLEKIWETIYKLEFDIRNKEILHEKKIRGLLSEEQKASIDSYANRMNFYGGRGLGRFGDGRYGYGQNDLGQRIGRLGRSYFGYGNVITRGIGRNIGYLGQGTGRIGYGTNSYLRGVRYGRGPCGAGLGRWYRMGYGKGRWNWRR